LLGIGDYTLRTWGKAQATRYVGELEVCSQTLSDNPALGRLCDPFSYAVDFDLSNNATLQELTVSL
jgi:plasmid stabilization system protein ParE